MVIDDADKKSSLNPYVIMFGPLVKTNPRSHSKTPSPKTVISAITNQSKNLPDNRPEAVIQRKIGKIANSNLDYEFQDILNAGTPGTIQRRGFADPANPDQTRQWEGRGSPWRSTGQERPASVSQKVDQFKKEMLTYIAHYIESRQNRAYYGPHVAVIISGNDWKVSVNSDVSAGKQATLQADANAAKQHIDNCWNALNASYDANYFNKSSAMGLWHNLKYQFQGADEEAVYIAFRWAASKANVNAILNPLIGTRKDGRRIHGEMKIVENLQANPLPGGAPVTPPGNTTAPPGSWRRVVRTGGTKTPCLDCAWEMDKVGYNHAQISSGAVGSHGPNHEAHMIGAGANERVLSTMSPTFGPGYPTWQSADTTRPRRTAGLSPGTAGAPAAAGFDSDQSQDFNALKRAYSATGCAPAMI